MNLMTEQCVKVRMLTLVTPDLYGKGVKSLHLLVKRVMCGLGGTWQSVTNVKLAGDLR